ncbi:NACHT, LRR and PYD domains-containing protein 12-like isoform X2 [Triplophysa rosa]|uniref:NACHT n=1 Tax=Triplophysa rosa TaxID=992332 RepID=A0A9W7T3Q6_TRIRA|nr:NACHT, LRR and PYD domains-containing protein 12-like isoform X2 [Triplophysa rosa]KAI7789516.1 putative NACHT [Triplophysa rosa]
MTDEHDVIDRSSLKTHCLLQPDSLNPSHELKTSNQSLDHLVEFKGSSLEQQGRSASPNPSHDSVKSSQSINHPRDFKASSLLQPGGSDPGHELKTSNQSLDHLVEFQGSVQQGRSASPSPSHDSTKSRQSINHPPDFKGPSLLLPVGSDSPRQERKSSMEHLEELSTITSIKSRNQLQCLHEGTSNSLVPLDDTYTELHITEGGCGEVNAEHEVRQIEAAFRRAAREEDRPIKCNDIFKPSSEQDKPIRTVLTRGVAGIGKTVSVQKFILDWAAGKENQDVHLIFPLPFRELNLMKDQKVSLKDVLHIFLPESKELDISGDKYKVLFIFDGLDECRLSLDFHSSVRLRDVNESASVGVMLTNLIAGNLLPSALIWITSRPAAADLIPSECVHRVTEVRGFTDPQKEVYFRKRIKDGSLANKIISHLKSSRSLYIMCHIPVFCWISATVLERMLSEAESDEEIPTTLTQMYTHFLLISIYKHEKDYERKMNNEDMIFKLGKLAFQQLEKGNLIFYEEDLRQCDIDVQEASVFSGLCTQIFREQSGLFQGKAYCFVHLSVQEHLAALYVFLTFINENVHVLDNPSGLSSILACAFASHYSLSALYQRAVSKALQSPNGHWDIFLRFFVGFSLESNQSLLQNLFTEPERLSYSKEIAQLIKTKIKENLSPEKSINLFHCLNELNDHYLVEEVQNYLKCGSVVNKTLSRSQWSALVFVLLTSGQSLDVFDLDNYVEKHITANAVIQWLRPVIEASKTARLCEHSLTQKDCATLVSALTSKTSCLRELILTDSNIKDAGVKHLCTGLANTHCPLEALRLKSCGITHEGCAALAFALRSNPSHLRELDLSGNAIRNSGVKLLSDELGNPLCKLEKILLRNCGITHEADAALVSLLSSNPSHLRELNLSKNKLGDIGIKLLSGALGSSNCELEILLLENCCIAHEGCAVLASALISNPVHLRELDLSANNLTNNGVKRLLVNLESSGCNLEILRLDNCGVTDEGCATLASALKSSCLNLKKLTLNWNKIGDSGVQPLFAALGDPNCKLQVLRLRDCKITDEGYDALASTLKTNPSHLKELDLSQNKLTNPGIKLLSSALAYPNCKLEILRLETCGITDNGCAVLASALRSNPSHLRELDLYMNNLGCLGGQLISEMKDDPKFKLEILKY